MLKVFDLPSDNGLPILASLTAEIGELLLDAELFSAFTKITDKFRNKGNLSKIELITVGFGQVVNLIPILLKKHPENIFNILSLLKEVPVDEIKKQSTGDTIKDIVEVLKDEGFRSFFTSFLG